MYTLEHDNICLQAAECIENGKFEGGDEKQVKALRVSCFLNGAACSLKLKNFLETIVLCSEVKLKKKKEVDSSLMRLGVAFFFVFVMQYFTFE